MKSALKPLMGLIGACAGSVSLAATLAIEVTDQSGAPIKDAVVYALPRSGQPVGRLEAAVAVAQASKQFDPIVSVVQTGTSVSFPNKDSFRHHVYSFSAPKVFELKLYGGDAAQAAPVLFDKPGLVVLGCNIHDQMIAFVQVVDTPSFGKTDARGAVRLDRLQGDYELRVWHHQAAKAETLPSQRLTLAADAKQSLRFTIELKQP